MEIIAITSNGALISATKEEIVEILRSVTGQNIEELKIGQKIPAIDYASSITKIKQLSKVRSFTGLEYEVDSFNKHFEELRQAVNNAASLEL